MTTLDAVIRAAVPNATRSDIEHILWARTPFPFGGDAKMIYHCARRWKRATDNNISLCEFCDRKVSGKRYTCDRCEAILSRVRE